MSQTIDITREGPGSTKVAVLLDGKDVSRLWIIHQTIRVGRATVKMDGIGGVGTEEEHRNRGLSRRCLEASVRHMIGAGDAAISMLYGIPDYYHKFGFATAGPEHTVEIDPLPIGAALPEGWTVRRMGPDDLPAVRRIHQGETSNGVGCKVRDADAAVWRRLHEPAKGVEEQARVLLDSSGAVVAYACRGTGFWSHGLRQREHPDWFIISEAMADGPRAADALLRACRAWASEPDATADGPARRVRISAAPQDAIALAAMHESASVVRRFNRSGESMIRLLNARRLLESLRPELTARIDATGRRASKPLVVRTDMGADETVIDATGDEVRIGDRDSLSGASPLELALPQEALARLAVGAFDPHDLLARLPNPPAPAEVIDLVATLFPQRPQHMYFPDRY